MLTFNVNRNQKVLSKLEKFVFWQGVFELGKFEKLNVDGQDVSNRCLFVGNANLIFFWKTNKKSFKFRNTKSEKLR